MTHIRQHLHEASTSHLAATPQEWMWDSVGEGREVYGQMSDASVTTRVSGKAKLDVTFGDIYRVLKESTLNSRTDEGRACGTLTTNVKEQG
jgi:hypothetical protein